MPGSRRTAIRPNRRRRRFSGGFGSSPGRNRASSQLQFQSHADPVSGPARSFNAACNRSIARFTACRNTVYDAIRRPFRCAGLALIGAATGACLALVAIAIAATAFPDTEPSLPPPQAAPDYLATIRAPTPTPLADTTAVGGTTHVDDIDIRRFIDWMTASAWLDAVAYAAQATDERLLALLAIPSDENRCYHQLAESIGLMARNGQLLGPTGAVTEQTVRCLGTDFNVAENAANYLALSPADRTPQLASMLTLRAIAANPYTVAAALEPSPRNVGLMRTVWPHQQPCREAITAMAAATALLDDPAAVASSLGQHFGELDDCLSRPIADMPAPADDAE